MAELYVLDPDGDLIVIHRAFRGPFAPWYHDEGPSDIRDGEPLPPPELRFKASAKHLAMAFPRFKKILEGPYKETNLPRPEVTIEGFDSEALEILLNIIHGKNSKVPRYLTLDMLAKVSELVDDLDCYEQAEVFGDIWIRQLERSFPQKYDRDLILWILISFVFRQSSLFKSATRIAILHSPDPFMTLELPIRPTIAERINRQRLELLERLVTKIHEVVNGLCEGDRCSFQCDSMTLGALVKQIQPLRLWPRPSEPYTELSFHRIAGTIRSLRSPHFETHLHLAEAEEYSPARGTSSYSKKMSKKGGKAMPSISWNTEIEAEKEAVANWEHECSLNNLKHLLVPDIDCLEHSVNVSTTVAISSVVDPGTNTTDSTTTNSSLAANTPLDIKIWTDPNCTEDTFLVEDISNPYGNQISQAKLRTAYGGAR
ncbi:hypothetical protein V491_03236 [Pseudogymnoascus sp. VKM F-3775]|nr:hypothetical protein V491_03236 [Pseudogymnoascus sp. VKM F-3775]